MASAKILADCTGRRLFVNWLPEKDCRVAWEDLFMNHFEEYPAPLSSFRAGIDFYDGTAVKVFDDGSSNNTFCRDMPQAVSHNTSDVVALQTWQNFQPPGIPTEAYQTAKSLFYRSLQPVAFVREAVDDIHKRNFEGAEVVGIHIRVTDHLSWAKKDPKLISPTELFIERMRQILDRSPQTKFFLSTDDKEVEDLMKQLFPGSIITYEKQAYDEMAVNRNTKRGLQEALIDWLLLSKTSRIVGSYASSFGREAGAVHMVRTDFILKREELSRIHYRRALESYSKYAAVYFTRHIGKPVKSLLRKSRRTPLMLYITGLYRVLTREGLRRSFLHSYSYRKEQISAWIQKRTTKP